MKNVFVGVYSTVNCMLLWRIKEMGKRMLEQTFLVNNQKTSVTQAPGPKEPVDEIVLEDFTQDRGWALTNAEIAYSSVGAKITLTDTTARLTKVFTYSTWQYSDLMVQIRSVTEGLTWALSVQDVENGSQEILLQEESSAANSRFLEKFNYSIKGIAGAEALSDWNDPIVIEKTFMLIFTFRGNVGESIDLGTIIRSQPSYDIPLALPSQVTGTIAGVDFGGDPTINVDELRNDDPVNSATMKEHRNLTLPFSRLVTNPEYNFDNQAITPVETSFDLRFGAYYGIRGNANKTMINGEYIREKKSGFQDSSLNALLSIDGVQVSEESLRSAWYPHKVMLSGEVPGGGQIATTDFFIDESTLGRIITLSQVSGDFFEIEMSDSTTSATDYQTNNLKCTWESSNQVVVKNDTQFADWHQNLFQTAIKVVALTESGQIDADATAQIIPPTFIEGRGKYQIPTTISSIALVIGYATKEEGVTMAITRALRGVGIGTGALSIQEHYAARKTYWDQLLASVPAPQTWGVSDPSVYHHEVVTIEKHRVLYYAGWTHLIGNILAPTEETGYAFTQQSLGKPSRQCAGASMTPANNCWEGLLQIQDLMYINPSIAWSGMEGFMSMVDANGFLSGEVLPVRMAQTIWMIHSLSPDAARLDAMYPALKRHLEWKLDNPRWVYETINVANEVDSEFMISAIYDTKFIIEICQELGGLYADEVAYWEARHEESLANYSYWMFCDPLSHEAWYSYPQNSTNSDTNRKVLRNGANLPDANYQRGIWQYFFIGCVDIDPDNLDERKFIHGNNGHLSEPPVSGSTTELPHMIGSGLVLPDLPSAQATQLTQFVVDIIDPSLALCGFPVLKWAPSSLLTYGVINRGFYDEAKALIGSSLVRAIEIWQFCENYFWNATGPKGTYPTSFGASQIVDNTWMMNGVINDGSGVREIPNWQTGQNKPTNLPLEITTDQPIDLNDPEGTLERLDLPQEIRQTYELVNGAGEPYQIGKIAAVTWDAGSLQQESTNSYTITGETEAHNPVEAHITSTS
ncbi:MULTISPECIES: hypothetical protein [unclassified Enterococcus]|uniref:hypothetical protein n=1 Tax=unclassified Enterococcus TaxID=2608891 RepID=UPI001A9BEF44|nr:hypothetical protein [Enterococcus sp. DIV1271a]MBO1300742.1 hypothetical protein [Enterococcus sp. DIV1271a]